MTTEFYPGETNGLIDPKGYHESVTHQIEKTVYWDAPGLKITRLRLLSDPGFPVWDVSYCHGELNGKPVDVQLPFFQLPKRGMLKYIVAMAKKDKVFAKGTGIFGCISTLI
ncbi:MAG: hypothetical protein ACWGQW_02030 [bacterium]